MIRHVCTSVATAAVFLGCGSDPVFDPDDDIQVARTPGLQGFESRLDSIRVQLQIPGMAASIAQDGEVVWARGFGEADAESGRAATGTTPFHLASLTKPFAATVLMGLVEEGMLSLDDPVSRYGVSLPDPDAVQVRHLLTHTSEGVPGSAYSYNGNRFGFLDRVIENATGRSFGALLVERILEPLALGNAAPNPIQQAAFALTGQDREGYLARMAAGYELVGGRVEPRPHPDYFGTSAGLVASAEDVARFSIAIDQERLLRPETWRQVFTPAVSNGGATLPYGLGWFIHDHQGVELQWHYGYWTTNSSLIVRVPDRRLTLVVLANTPQMSAA